MAIALMPFLSIKAQTEVIACGNITGIRVESQMMQK
jgi:hypothetical protein